MTPIQDMFVGLVAIACGSLLLLGAILDGTPLMSLRKAQWLMEVVGRGPARAIIGAIGLATIALGLLIASGWRVAW